MWLIQSLKEKFHNTTDSDEASAAAFLDISVSFDGTWMHQGFSSHISARFLIECETGIVIDYIALSNNCTLNETQKILSPEAFTHWKVSLAVFCKQNFQGK